MLKASLAASSMERTTVSEHLLLRYIRIPSSDASDIRPSIAIEVQRRNPTPGRLGQKQIPLFPACLDDRLGNRPREPFQVDRRSSFRHRSIERMGLIFLFRLRQRSRFVQKIRRSVFGFACNDAEQAHAQSKPEHRRWRGMTRHGSLHPTTEIDVTLMASRILGLVDTRKIKNQVLVGGQECFVDSQCQVEPIDPILTRLLMEQYVA